MLDKIVDSFASVDGYALAEFGIAVAIAAVIAVPVTAYIIRRGDNEPENSLTGLDTDR